MIVDLAIAIGITRYLRKTLHTAEKMPKWDKVFNYIFYAAIGLLVVDMVVKQTDPVMIWLAHALLLYFIYILYKEPELAGAKQTLFAIAPYIILSLFSDIAKLINADKFSAWKSFIEIASVFSVIWMVTMWIIISRQNKALQREQVKAQQEEEKRKHVVSLKDQLEIQVAERTAELTKQKEELEHALTELKATQAQLIQAEKMASLGELTAGIAHEIQNPLNFVNNFSEVSNELIDELNAERLKPKAERNEELENEILEDIKQNLEKIAHHGKRADGIVKGMLQHSRKNTGQKEMTDINALADEYLRLSYHGLRAKDKTFNAAMKTEFDAAAPKINVVPQDIGRVLLNLINNAFYAVSEKKKQQPEGYEPAVKVSTKYFANWIWITVSDNGGGIPQEIIDKIFQPFFTTKPTGQGTGLGLSLSYDIIKAHGGELKVKNKESEGAAFIIQLPVAP
ncbi:MAG: histidine kinase [Bacteroidetes bacterium]|nr:histidine kinase [Bacteroidota bacterium]